MGRFSRFLASAAAVLAAAGGATAQDCSAPCATDLDCAGLTIGSAGSTAYCAPSGVCEAIEEGTCDALSPPAGSTLSSALSWTQYSDTNHAFYCNTCFKTCTDASTNWHAVQGTTILRETGADTAEFRGQIFNTGNPALVMDIVAELGGKIFVAAGESGAPSGSPKGPKAGGPSVNDYTYYTEAAVRMTGSGAALDGLDIRFVRKGPAFQLAVGGNDKDSDLGASMWMMVDEVVSQPSAGGSCSFSGGSTIDFNLDLNGACSVSVPCDEPPVLPPAEHQCIARRSIASPDTCTRPGTHALTLSGIGTFTFEDDSGRWSVFADGTAAITGIVSRSINGVNAKFQAYYIVKDRITEPELCTGPGTEPETGSFCDAKRELWNSNADQTIGGCYSDEGGPIDVTQWSMWLGVVEGSLYGIAGEPTEGYKIELAMRGPSLQFGAGAGGKNIDLGASGWVSHRVTSTGSGLATLDSLAADGNWRNGDWNLNIECGGDVPIVPCPSSGCDTYEVECGCECGDIWSMNKCARVAFVAPADPDNLDCEARHIPCF